MLEISISEAVNMVLCQVNLTDDLPFEINLPAHERVIVRSKKELYKKLDESEAEINFGKTSSNNEIINKIF